MARIFALVLFLALFLYSPFFIPRSQAEDPLKALLVMAFAPGDPLRQAAEGDLQETVEILEGFGFQVFVLDAYNPDGTVFSPHYRLHCQLEDNTYHLLVYYGHGDANRWAFCLFQDPEWAGRNFTPSYLRSVFRDHYRPVGE